MNDVQYMELELFVRLEAELIEHQQRSAVYSYGCQEI